jgi:hypothetical protein
MTAAAAHLCMLTPCNALPEGFLTFLVHFAPPSTHILCQDSSIMNNMYGFVDRLLATLQIVGVICVSL